LPPAQSVGHSTVRRNQLIAFRTVDQRLSINARAAADECGVAPIHLAADDEQVAVDSRRWAQQDIGVDRQHAADDMPGNDERPALHGDVSRHLLADLDLEAIGRAQRIRPIPFLGDFAPHFTGKLLSVGQRPALRAGG
jgi:hypothetical protein